MRVVTSNMAIWKLGGLASTDAAPLMGCAVEEDDNPLTLWAKKIWMRERKMRKAATLQQDSTEWHDWRKKGVGGSEVAAVVGASPYQNAEQLWEIKTKPVKGEAENANMKRGKQKEPVARALYEKLFGHSVAPCCVLHDVYDFIRASLDGITTNDEIIAEIKCCGERNHQRLLDIETVEDPLLRQMSFCEYFPYYRFQVLYQLLITGAKVCHFIGYNESFSSNKKLAVIELYPEPEEQERLLNRVIEFWGYVERREPPPFEFTLPCWEPPVKLKMD